MDNIHTVCGVLFEAYEHYENTGDVHFEVLPKNPGYLLSVLNSVGLLQKNGYISNISDNLLNDDPVSIAPAEKMSFDITAAGIRFARNAGKR